MTMECRATAGATALPALIFGETVTWILICPRSSGFSRKASTASWAAPTISMRARNTWRRRAAGAKASGTTPARTARAGGGLWGLPFSEDDGGFGAGAVETMIVMEALGKALVLEPYLATVVIGGGFLRHGGSAEQKAAHIPGIIDGSKTFAFAQLEKNSRYDLGDVSATAKKKS